MKQPARLPKSQSKGLNGRAERVQRDCAPKKLDHDYRGGPALTQHYGYKLIGNQREAEPRRKGDRAEH
jgi:hypothetical protein